MGRRPGSRRSAICVYQLGKLRRPSRTACWVAGLLVWATAFAPPSSAAPLAKGSNSREDRAEATREIPFDRLTPEAQQKILRVVQKPSLFRRMPTNVIDCDPQIYRFLIRYPEVVVNIWQLMGITKVTADRTGPFMLSAQDGVGTTTTIELIYGDNSTHLMYCEGHYEGPLFPRPLTGRCVLVLKSDYDQTPEARWQITNRMDVFLQIDNMAVDAVTRTLHPLLGKSADLNFVQSTQFLERISRTSEENGPGMSRLAQRLDNVQPQVRSEFAQVTQTVHEMAQSRGVQTVAQNPSAGRTPSPQNQ